MKTPSAEIFSKYMDPEIYAKIRDYDTVSEMWEVCVASYGDAAAIEDNGVTYTYRQLEESAAKLRPLVLAGAEEGTRVAILSANSFDFVRAYLAIVTSGCTAVILPPQLDETAVFGCAMKYGYRKLICQPEMKGKTNLLCSRLGASVTVIGTDESADSAQGPVACKGETPCVIMFTGGTTGKSKGALLSNAAVMQGTVNGCYGCRDLFGQRYILVLPLSHVFGLIRNLMTSLYTGSDLFICRNNKDMFRDIAMFRPTVLVVVPALAEMALTLSRKFGRNMLGDSMKYIICGAAAVPPYLVKEYKKFGIDLFPGYGLTESANLVSGNPESERKPDSVGIMYPNQEYRIENGELWLKGRNMMTCYIGEDEDPCTDGWFRTGDLVRIDEEGFLYITGRIKEIIVLANGENVSPAEVEAHFNELNIIQDSQVFEDVTENGTHILALEVVPRVTELGAVPAEEREAYILEELKKVNRTLPAYQQVSRMVVRKEDFARTPSMKIARYKKC